MRPLLLLLVLLLSAPAFGFEDPALGLQVPDPAGWELRSEKEEGALVRWYAPPGPGPRTSIGVSAQELGEVEALDPALVQAAVQRLRADLEGFRLLGLRKEKVAGLPGYRLGYKAKAHGHVFRATQVMTVQGGRLFVFTLTTSEDGHGPAAPTFDKMLKGVTFAVPE